MIRSTIMNIVLKILNRLNSNSLTMPPIAMESILQSREEWDGDGDDRGGDRASALMEIRCVAAEWSFGGALSL